MSESFELLSVVHLVRPAGRSAHHLEALREGIAQATPSTLFLHSHHHRNRHPAVDELPLDDFSSWVHGVVQDRETAERLSFAVQNRAGSAEELREGLLHVLESLPLKSRESRDAPEEGDFVFLDFESVTVPTGRVITSPQELVAHLSDCNSSVLFYHLIEQPWLDPERHSLAAWVRDQGNPRLAGWLEQAGLSGRPLESVRKQLVRRWRQSSLGRRLADAALEPESDRRAEARRAVAGLVRRMTGTAADGAPERDRE